MVGYVELGRIDRPSKSAAVELPLIDPAEPERADLSVALLRAVVAMAAGPLELVHLDADVPGMREGSVQCYRMAGFLEEPVLPGTRRCDSSPKCTWNLL